MDLSTNSCPSHPARSIIFAMTPLVRCVESLLLYELLKDCSVGFFQRFCVVFVRNGVHVNINEGGVFFSVLQVILTAFVGRLGIRGLSRYAIIRRTTWMCRKLGTAPQAPNEKVAATFLGRVSLRDLMPADLRHSLILHFSSQVLTWQSKPAFQPTNTPHL